MQKRIIFRLPDSMYEQVNKAVKDGEVETLSQIIRKALQLYFSPQGQALKNFLED